MEKEGCAWGAQIERGVVCAVTLEGYTVESFDRPGVTAAGLRDMTGTERRTGEKVYFFLHGDGTGRILCGMD